jgi:two-component system, cell cycle sensor histidine kinase and response regulator CckA
VLRESIATSRAFHETLFEHSPDAIVGFAADGTIRTCNPAAVRLYGYGHDEMIGMPASRLIDEGDRSSFRKRLDEIAAGGAPHSIELVHVRRDGLPLAVDTTIVAIRRADGACTDGACTDGACTDGVGADYAMMNRDLAPIRLLQSQFRQAQRMEAIGLLAGGVVHDFNNLLTVISGYSNMLIEELALSEQTREFAEEIRSAGERAANLTRQLNAYTRKQLPVAEAVNLNDVVNRLKRLLRRLIGEHIEMEFRLDPAPHTVRADRGQLEQVLMNLVVNARDAMPSGGRLTIETAVVDRPPGPPDEERSLPAIHLRVTDTGCGMTPEIQARIFEPLFTTKEAGKGTGLGLAMVYGFVTAIGGTVSVVSEVGIGSTFTISLPIVATESNGEAITVGTPTTPPHGTETILVVEDDPSVRQFACAALRSRGYKVLEAGDAEEAIRHAQSHEGAISLLMTDVVMPGMDGPALAREILARWPAMRVLFATGYHDGRIERHGIADATHARVQKPYSTAELATRVRRVLDGGP